LAAQSHADIGFELGHNDSPWKFVHNDQKPNEIGEFIWLDHDGNKLPNQKDGPYIPVSGGAHTLCLEFPGFKDPHAPGTVAKAGSISLYWLVIIVDGTTYYRKNTSRMTSDKGYTVERANTIAQDTAEADGSSMYDGAWSNLEINGGDGWVAMPTEDKGPLTHDDSYPNPEPNWIYWLPNGVGSEKNIDVSTVPISPYP
jgi:hypothetical protein